MGFASQNDRRLHFGLGPATKIDKLEVKWPDGAAETINVPGVDRIITISEKQGVLKTP